MKIRETEIKYLDSENAESGDLRKQWINLKTQGQKQRDDISVLGRDLYSKTKSPDDDLTALMALIQQRMLIIGKMRGKPMKLAKMLLNDKPEGTTKLGHPLGTNSIEDAAKAAIKTNNFDFASDFIADHGDMLEEISEKEPLFEHLPELVEKHNRELELQAAESAADDLPRVTLMTTKGEIVLELFENEAPSTVANFLAAVEEKYYNNKIIPSRHQGLHGPGGGLLDKDMKFEDSGYTIYDECGQPNARHHFRGSIQHGQGQ